LGGECAERLGSWTWEATAHNEKNQLGIKEILKGVVDGRLRGGGGGGHRGRVRDDGGIKEERFQKECPVVWGTGGHKTPHPLTEKSQNCGGVRGSFRFMAKRENPSECVIAEEKEVRVMGEGEP